MMEAELRQTRKKKARTSLQAIDGDVVALGLVALRDDGRRVAACN